MQTENQISNEHITNNKSVRKTLLERWIVPENLSPSEDVKKLERKLKTKDNKEINKKWFKKK
jgi:DNA-damage-inducible protein D